MKKLVNAGLDEIRIHVTGSHSWRALGIAMKFSDVIDVGIENPAVPGMIKELKELVMRAHDMGVKFVNINELEFSVSNYYSLTVRGFRVKDDGVAAAESEETALELLKWVVDEGLTINIHYCPARFKDRYQFRLRMYWRGLRCRRVFEVVSNDGLVRWASIKSVNEDVIKKLYLSDAAILLGNELLTNPIIAKYVVKKYEVIEAYPTIPRRVLNVIQY